MFAATFVAATVVSVIFVAGSGAVLAPPANFEGNDGNLIVNTAPNKDWVSFPINCATGAGCLVDAPSGATDNSFGQGTQEDDTSVTVVDGSIPPNKNDLTRAYIASETLGGNTYLYLAWERLVNTGSANIDFELNQKPQNIGAPGATYALDRTAGDILIAYVFGGSGTPTISLLRWVASGPGSQCDKANTTPCWGTRVDMTAVGFAEALVNPSPVSDPFLSATPNNVGTGLFGEAALNLSDQALHIFEPHTCKAFGGMYVKSRASGSSIDAELKDFIAPVPIFVSNCGSIELKKHWAGTAGSTTLKIGTSAGGDQTASQVVSGGDGSTSAKSVENGDYFVSEDLTNAGDYTTTLSCTDNAGTPFDPAAGAIPVSGGHQVVCTFTNSRKTGTIKLQKHWVGTAGNASLAIGSSGPGSANVATGTANGADGAAGPATVDTGTYFVSEQFDSNLYTTSLACFNDANNNGVNDAGDSTVTVGANDSVPVGDGQHVICTYTDTRKTGTLEVKKVLNPTNDSGKFDLTIDSTTYTNGGAGFGNNGTTGQITVDSGSHSASEAGHSPTALSNYVSSYSCSNGLSGNGTSITGITVNAGDHVVCTFTNARKPQLTLVKTVTNDNGGQALPTAWLLSATGPGGDPNSFSGQGGAGPHDVTAGAAYALAESGGPSGYTAGNWSCNGGSQNGASITLAAGQSATCTINNNDQAAHLIVIKHVDNNDGGTKVAADFSLTIGGVTAVGGNTFAGAESPGVDKTLSTVGAYNVTEGAHVGYDVSYSAGCTGTIANGETKTCTVTNNDQAAHLIVIKHVINDDGGTKTAADFTLDSGGVNDTPDDFAGAESPGTTVGLSAGSYNVTEGAHVGYTVTYSADCSGTIANNETKTCTVTNDDQAAHLIVIKLVVNDNAGTKTVADFTLTADGAGSNDLSGTSPVDSGAGLLADTWTLSETNVAGYTASDWVCVGGTQDGSKITVGVGGEATCTITNNDNAPELHLRKVVVNDNGGTATAADFTLTADGAGSNDLSGPGPDVDSGPSLEADTWTLSETSLAGYTASDWVCEGGTQDGNKITVGNGGSATCTITNNDIAPTITVLKRIVPTNDTGTFDFVVDAGEGQLVLDNAGQGYGNNGTAGPVDVQAGNHTVSETGHGATNLASYSSTWSCSSNKDRSQSDAGTSISLSGLTLGENVTCTFTNTKLATLIVKKVVDNSNGGGAKGPGDFTIHVTTAGLELPNSPAPGSLSGTTYLVLPGTYKVTEGAVSGYSLTSTTGCLADGSVVLEAGATVTCTLTNTSAAPPPPPPPAPPAPPAPKVDVQITKTGAPNPATVGSPVTWTMVVTNNGPNNATGVTASDPVPAGTTFVSVTTSQGTCTGGAIVSCQLGNLNVGASVTITLVTTATSAITVTNTVTTVAKEAETNTANNTATSSVKVNGPFIPPAVFCTAVSAPSKTLFVGRTTVLSIKVRQNGKAVKGIRIKINGPSLKLTTDRK